MMSTITTQLKARFRFTNKLLRSCEQKAAALPIGAREHRLAMERVFDTEEQRFDLIAIMSAIEQTDVQPIL